MLNVADHLSKYSILNELAFDQYKKCRNPKFVILNTVGMNYNKYGSQHEETKILKNPKPDHKTGSGKK